jgi:L-malate glycosyltransferase
LKELTHHGRRSNCLISKDGGDPNKLKLLYVTTRGAVHDYRFLNKLVNDYDVTLLHYETGNVLSEQIRSLKNIKVIVRKSLFRSFPLTDLRFFRKLIRETKPDIVHTGYVWQTGVLGAYSGFHPHLSMPWGSDVLIEPNNNPYIKKLTRKVLTSADHIQCDAEFVKKKIMLDYKVSAEKITVFPWGIDLGMFGKADKSDARKLLNISPEKFVILFTRPLEHIYDLNTLLSGFLQFSAGKEDILLIIANEGGLRPFVEKFILKYQMQEKINLTGWIANEKLPALFNASDIFVSTSLSDGASLSLLEAMACGKGLILTKLPAILEWVDDENGILIDKQNPEELYSSLNKYYHQRELIEAHGGKSIQIAKERADWDRNYEKLKVIYGNLLNK